MRLWLGENETATDVSHTSHAVALYAIPYILFFPHFIMILLISLSLWLDRDDFFLSSIPNDSSVGIAMFGFFVSFHFYFRTEKISPAFAD